jgi:hypothetical protein
VTKLLLEGIAGSTAYGLSRPGSDLDYIGIYVEPTRNFLGLHPPSRERATRKGRGGADGTFHEIGKSMTLMLACNPHALEILWLDNYTHSTGFGWELIALRDCFLSAQNVRDRYFEYARGQLKRLVNSGRFAGSLETRREKHARHTMRILWQGYELYTTGTLPIRVPAPELLFEFGQRVAHDPDARAAETLIAEYEAKFDDARTVLPAEPTEAPLEDLLQRIRRAHLEIADGGRS